VLLVSVFNSNLCTVTAEKPPCFLLFICIEFSQDEEVSVCGLSVRYGFRLFVDCHCLTGFGRLWTVSALWVLVVCGLVVPYGFWLFVAAMCI
jgi:hypothetical protein